MSSKKKERGVLRKVYGYYFPSAWKQDKGYFFCKLAQLIISSVSPLVTVVFIPEIVAELIGEKRSEVLIQLVVLLVGIQFVLNLLSALFRYLVEKASQRFEDFYSGELSKRIMELDFQLTEDKKALDQLELAKNGMNRYSGGLNGLMEPFFNAVSSMITLAGVTYLIVIQAPFVLLIATVVVAMTTVFNVAKNKIEQKGYRQLSKIDRIFGYLGFGLADFRYGKDIRLYDSKDMMVGKWKRYTEEYNDKNVAIANKMLPLQLGTVMTNILHDAAIYIYLGFLGITGQITIAVCVQMISAAGTFTNSLKTIMTCYTDIVKRANYANEYVKFMDYPAAMEKGEKKIGEGLHVFEFKNVSFAYPGSEVSVLKNMNLTIHEGEHLSIVGLNGAGKTTMVKLLCRLYDPTEGEILMDGVNIKEYDYESYMKAFAPVFQDFQLFAFSIRENLLLKEEFNEEDEKIASATLTRVGINDKLRSFTKGLDTILFKRFDMDGIEPSGGEKQKIAIARALIKDAPVVILDEPTAALDPIAEYEIYRQFEDMVEGKTAIYISHRLSSCQFCDRIAVFSEGYVKECGTHAELVNKEGGIYAEMFAAQAQYYRDENNRPKSVLAVQG